MLALSNIFVLMRLILFSFVVLSNFIFAQTDSIKIDSGKVNVVDSIKRSNEIDEVTITQFSVKKLNSPISTDVYSQQFFRKNPTPNVFESIAMVPVGPSLQIKKLKIF